MNIQHGRKVLFLVAMSVSAAVLISTACSRKDESKAAGPPPPPSVVVAEVGQRTVPIYSEFVGQTAASQTVEVRARVQGMLEKILFTEGAPVRKGQLLFQIQKSEYEARVLA